MLDHGKVTDTIYKRSVQKVIKKNHLNKEGHTEVMRDVHCYNQENGHAVVTASAVLNGTHLMVPDQASLGGKRLAAAGALHLAVNRLAAAGSRAQMAAIQLIVPEDTPEKEIKAMIGAVSECCEKLQIASVQADVMAAAGLTAPVVSVTATGEADSLFEVEKAEADQDIIMAGYAGGMGAAWLAFDHQTALEQHFNPVFLSPVLDADYTEYAISALPAIEAAAAAGVKAMYACGEGGVYTAVWELAEAAGLGARIQLKEVPLKQETVEICDYFNISPYQLLSTGAVLLTATHGQKVLAELAAAGIPAVIIGHLTDDNDRVVINEEEVRFLEPFRGDSLNQAKAAVQF